jgi:hypothetical protein
MKISISDDFLAHRIAKMKQAQRAAAKSNIHQ